MALPILERLVPHAILKAISISRTNAGKKIYAIIKIMKLRKRYSRLKKMDKSDDSYVKDSPSNSNKFSLYCQPLN